MVTLLKVIGFFSAVDKANLPASFNNIIFVVQCCQVLFYVLFKVLCMLLKRERIKFGDWPLAFSLWPLAKAKSTANIAGLVDFTHIAHQFLLMGSINFYVREKHERT